MICNLIIELSNWREIWKEIKFNFLSDQKIRLSTWNLDKVFRFKKTYPNSQSKTFKQNRPIKIRQTKRFYLSFTFYKKISRRGLIFRKKKSFFKKFFLTLILMQCDKCGKMLLENLFWNTIRNFFSELEKKWKV